MNRTHRIVAGLAAVIVGGGLVASPAAAGPPPAPVALVVGLAPGADAAAPVERLAEDVDVVDVDQLGSLPAVTVDVAPGDVAEAAAALREDPAVRYVEPERYASAAAVTADDTYRATQWGLDRANVPGAWQRTTGSAGVTVAVVDTGVDEVSDLSGAVLDGYDFVNEDSDAGDDEGHGTMVAGVIASRGNNGAGTAGICWSCKILPVKVLDTDGTGSYSDIAAGITWAADNGADIINLSLGGPDDSQALRDAVAHAIAQGALVLAAAGNDGVDDLHYPAAVSTTLAVGGSGSADTRYSWSNYGSSWVDLAAPGCNPAQAMDGSVYDFCGTSSATPFVAGVAALVLAGDPDATANELRTALTATAAPIGGDWVSEGRVDALAALQSRTPAGYGAPTATVSAPTANAFVRGTVGVTATASDTDGSVDRVEFLANGELVASDSTAPYTASWNTASYPRRTTLTAVAVDDGGHVGSADRAVVVDNTAPTVGVAAPAYLAKVRGRVTVRTTPADPSGITKVELLVGGSVVATDTTSPFSPVWNSAGRNGRVTITARAYDAAGNTATALRTVTADNIVPKVGFRSGPANGAKVSRTVYIGASASDTYGVGRVELLVNGATIARDTTAPYSFALNPAGRPRTLSVRLRAYDRAGNVRYSVTRTYHR